MLLEELAFIQLRLKIVQTTSEKGGAKRLYNCLLLAS
jgi:hypothetical protein